MTLPRVIGLGSHHGDDRAGWLIVDRLRELGYAEELLRKIAHSAELLNELPLVAPLLICDACECPGEVGAIHQWQWPTDSLAGLRSRGTHNLPLTHVLELADQFTDYKIEAEIWGVTGKSWTPASPPCQAVQIAARTAAAQIRSRYRA